MKEEIESGEDEKPEIDSASSSDVNENPEIDSDSSATSDQDVKPEIDTDIKEEILLGDNKSDIDLYGPKKSTWLHRSNNIGDRNKGEYCEIYEVKYCYPISL